jgi:nucleotide-binding universal stress UspA family protein
MRPLQTIAVGFDGSLDAEAAVRWAFELASQVDADVVVIHAVGLLEYAAHRGVAVELEKTVERLAREAGIDSARVHWNLADGDPCSVLIRAGVGPVAADLLVVGSRGQGAHAGLLLGSTSHELAEHAAVPVVIVPTGREGQ